VVFYSWLHNMLTTLQDLMAEIAGGCILLFFVVGAFFCYCTLQ